MQKCSGIYPPCVQVPTVLSLLQDEGSEWDSTAAPHSVPRSAASTSHFLLVMFHFAFRFRESSASLLVDVSNRSGSRDPKIERDARDADGGSRRQSGAAGRKHSNKQTNWTRKGKRQVMQQDGSACIHSKNSIHLFPMGTSVRNRLPRRFESKLGNNLSIYIFSNLAAPSVIILSPG